MEYLCIAGLGMPLIMPCVVPNCHNRIRGACWLGIKLRVQVRVRFKIIGPSQVAVNIPI